MKACVRVAIAGLLCACSAPGHDGTARPPASSPAAAVEAAAVEAAAVEAAAVEAAAVEAAPDAGPAAYDPGAPGRWTAGVRTLTLDGVTVEIFYPSRAVPARVRFDPRSYLPDDVAVADAETPFVEIDAARDAPLDEAGGPYPVVLFAHGYGLFRWQSASLCAHWARRGLVVVAPDWPGAIYPARREARTARLDRDAGRRVLRALAAPGGPAAYLDGHLELGRLGLVGHSLGALLVARMVDVPGVRVVVAMAETGTRRGPSAYRSLVIGGTADGFAPWRMQARGYARSPAPKRLVGLDGGGHLWFTDLCAVARDRGGLLAALLAAGSKVAGFSRKLAAGGCRDGTLALDRAAAIVRHVTTAALEEALLDSPAAAAALSALPAAFPEIARHAAEP